MSEIRKGERGSTEVPMGDREKKKEGMPPPLESPTVDATLGQLDLGEPDTGVETVGTSPEAALITAQDAVRGDVRARVIEVAESGGVNGASELAGIEGLLRSAFVDEDEGGS